MLLHLIKTKTNKKEDNDDDDAVFCQTTPKIRVYGTVLWEIELLEKYFDKKVIPSCKIISRGFSEKRPVERKKTLKS